MPCSDCKHSKPDTDSVDTGNYFRCHRYPPVVLPFMGMDGVLEVTHERPKVSFDDTCGEHDDGSKAVVATSSMIMPWPANTVGQGKFDDWLNDNHDYISVSYEEDGLSIYENGVITAKAFPGDRLTITSDGITVQ